MTRFYAKRLMSCSTVWSMPNSAGMCTRNVWPCLVEVNVVVLVP